MCGIAGLFLPKVGMEVPVLLHQMVETLAHRGPDDEGYLLIDNLASDTVCVPLAGPHTRADSRALLKEGDIEKAMNRAWLGGLGHRRLSIFDLSAAGHQPMIRGKYALVFNGAIYNFKEIREELRRLGHVFFTETDTEVVLLGYLQWQERVLPRLDGMFAFAILDMAEAKVFAARDRLGVKPFYYVDQPNGFAFASEQKALYPLPFCPKRISKTAVFEFLVQGKHEGRESGLYKAVHELLPGHFLEFFLDKRNSKISEWYTLSTNLVKENYKESSYKRHRDKVAHHLLQSVTMHLQADVSVGACLSGGLDSSALVGMATSVLSQNNGSFAGLPVFTASFPGTPFDETDLAQGTAKDLGARWFGVSPTVDELSADLVDFVRTHDVPLQTPSSYAQYRVMQRASKEGVKITLDGQGADELFGGYALQFQSFFLQLLSEGNYYSALTQFTQADNNFANRAQIIKTLTKGLQGKLMPRTSLESAYKKRYPELQFLRNSFWDVQKRRLKEELFGVKDGLNARLTADLKGSTMRTHLRIADRNSMRFGIESRVPFADSKDLIDLVQMIPSIYKIKNGQNKSLLRSAVRKWVSPNILNARYKTGFEGPNKLWIEHLSPVLQQAILTPGMEEFIHINTMHQHWDILLKQALVTDPHRLFRFAALGLWMKEYGVSTEGMDDH